MTNDVVSQQHIVNKFFPEIDPGITPFGSRVLVQIRAVKELSAGGIFLPPTTTDTERDNTQVALVRAVGPLSYRNRNTMELWPEGAWCAVGEFVFVPKYGGMRFERKVPDGVESYEKTIQFAIVDDLNITGGVDDPFAFKAFV